MNKFFTSILAFVAVMGSFSVEAQDWIGKEQVKAGINPISVNEPGRLNRQSIATKADYTPFPDSTITYDLKGNPIAIERYKYNQAGMQISYHSYEKDEKTQQWVDNVREIYTYDSAGNELTYMKEVWDSSKRSWIGTSKRAFQYNSEGLEIFSEYYKWDAQRNDWTGQTKYTTDYETGNRRRTEYLWNPELNNWILFERIEYAPDNVTYNERWGGDGTWGEPWKEVRKEVISYSQAGLFVDIDEVHTISKKNGKWDDDNPNWVSIFYNFGSFHITGWYASGYKSYQYTSDSAGRITSVTLTAFDDETFTNEFTYDSTINKLNSAKVIKDGKIVDHTICQFDAQGRVIEEQRNYEHDSEKEDIKYAYTFIGDSQLHNSKEYYLWDSSRKVFVKQKKDMYVRDHNDEITMHQTYSWAQTQWVLSSYTIYYPNKYTSDLNFDEEESVGTTNKGSFRIGFNLPQDAEVSGIFYITLPKGFTLDTKNTVPAGALAGKYSIVITPQEQSNTWLVEIKQTSSLKSASSAYQEIMTVAYTVDEETKQGDYQAEISNLNFVLSDGTILIEQKREVTLSVDRFGVANEKISSDDAKVWAADNLLYIKASEKGEARIYDITGQLIELVGCDAGNTITRSLPKGKVYFVKMSDGKAFKVIL